MSDFEKELLNFSKMIFEQTQGMSDADAEHYLRTAVSKSYYSAYHKVKPISDHLPQASAKGSHNIVIKTLAEAPRSSIHNNDDLKLKLTRLSIYLGQLFAARVHADYHPDHAFSSTNVQVHINTVEKVLPLCLEVKDMLFQKKAV